MGLRFGLVTTASPAASDRYHPDFQHMAQLRPDATLFIKFGTPSVHVPTLTEITTIPVIKETPFEKHEPNTQ